MPISRFSLAFLGLLPCMALSATTSLQDISQLFRQGQHVTALNKLDAYLSGNPKDAQGRFLKGLILTELNRYQEAIKVFSDLTQDFPELPEPYNNLAVLYAAQGQYDRAKQSLEQAIRTHPSYATAHENLGDIYAKMASLAYDKALQLDESNVSAQTKLALIRDLFSTTRSSDTAKPETDRPASVKAAAKPVAKSATKPPAKPSTAPDKLASTDKEAASAQPETPASAPATPEPSPTPAPPAASPTGKTGPETSAALEEKTAPTQPAADRPGMTPAQLRTAVEQTLTDWAAAWSRQDVEAYLSFYGADFKPPKGQDRAAWEQERRARLKTPASIKVEISKLRIDLRGDQARARFNQRYEADHMKGTFYKTVELKRVDGTWKIVSER